MQYNTAKNALVTINTTEGNVSLFWDQVTSLLDMSTTISGIKTMTANSGTGTYDKFVVDIDLGVRLHTAEVKYYFNSDVSSSAVASGILFQYKNEYFQDYISLSTFFNQDYYYTNTSGTLFAPRYVKLTHELSETNGFLTTLSGYVIGEICGFEILNDDTYVNFGVDGTTSGDTIAIARETAADIREVQIYNSSLFKTTAYVSLDPTYTDLDKVMAVSITESGPWIYPMDENLIIMRVGENEDYGVYDDTQLENGIISISKYIDAYNNLAVFVENGSYTTKVFLNNDTFWNSIIVDRILPLNGSLQVDSNDGTETVEARSSNSKPKSYHIYRELYTYHGLGGYDYLKYSDKWVETDQVKTTGTILKSSWSSGYIDKGWKNYFIVIDQKTERFGGFAFANVVSTSEWCVFNTDSNLVTKSKVIENSPSQVSLSFDWKDVKFDYEGGMWVHFFATSYGNSNFVNNTGYYLCYFDSSLTEKFKYFNTTDSIGVLDIDYDTKYLWYTLPNSNQIQKIDYDGTILYNHFENTDVLGGLCVLSDGTVWYANFKNLYKLKSNGIIDDEIMNVADDLFLQVAPDGDGTEALWVLENFYVSRIIISGENKGTKEFSIHINYALKLYPVESGVWVKCMEPGVTSGSYMYYISKVNKCIDREYKLDYNSTLGVLEQTYEDSLYANKIPLSIDQIWSNLEWNKVNMESFILSEDKYQQIKVTLRRQTPYQKYGSNVAFDSVFYTDDNFNQPNGNPNIMVWGEYRGDNRVYVENNQLVMTNDLSGIYDSYINTKNKYVLAGDFDIQFDYIMGDGIQTDKTENIYLYAYATDTDIWGQYFMSRIYIPSSPSSASCIYYYINTSSTYTSLGVNYDRWTGKLRLKRDGNNVYGYVWDPQTSSWKGAYRSGVDVLGNYFYLQIITSRTGSNIYIDNFIVNTGTAYYYTETPKIKGIYIRKEIEIKDIYPNTSKNIYLKSYIAQGLDVENHYDTTLRARWRTPV